MKITKTQLKQIIKEELDALGEGSFPKHYDVRGPEGEPTGTRVSADGFVMVDESSLMRMSEIVDFAKGKGSTSWIPETYTVHQGQLMPMADSPLGRMQAEAALTEEDA